MHEKYHTLAYSGYLYGVTDADCLEAVRYIFGDVAPVTGLGFTGQETGVNYEVKDEKLFIRGLKIHLPQGEVPRGRVPMDVNQVEKLVFQNSELTVQAVDEILCEGLALFFPYTGAITARQYYTDEVEWGAKMLEQKSVFFFCNGCLDAEKSSILQRDETFMSQLCWDESKRNLPAEPDGKQNKGRRWYFIDPVGSYLQNEHLLNVYINYCASGRIKDAWLDEILSAKEPVLRCVLMSETEPGSNDFREQSADLVCAFLRSLDAERMKRVYDWISFEKYGDYPHKMLEALLVESRVFTDNNSEEKLEACIEILTLFSSKGLKVREIEQYVEYTTTHLQKGSQASRVLELLQALRL